MEKRIKDMIDAMDGKMMKKGKKYVDDDEYEKMTGKKAMMEDMEMEDEEEDEGGSPRHGKIFGKGLSIIIALGKKK